VIGRLNDIVYSQENYLQHSPQAPYFNYTPPGERLFEGPPNSPCTHTVPTSPTLPYSHPESATSPYENSSQHWPWFNPKAGDLWEDIQAQGEEHSYWGGPSLPLAVSRPPEGPLYPSPYHSPSRRTGDGVTGVRMSRGQRYPTSDTRTDERVADSPPLGSLLQVMRGVAAPPLVSLPPSKPSAVHESSTWYAPSNLTVTLEGLMLRYQVRQACR